MNFLIKYTKSGIIIPCFRGEILYANTPMCLPYVYNNIGFRKRTEADIIFKSICSY